VWNLQKKWEQGNDEIKNIPERFFGFQDLLFCPTNEKND